MAITKSQKVTLISVLVLVMATYLVSLFLRKSINDNPRYTVGFVYDYMDGGSTGPSVFYYYYVNNKKYENSDYQDRKNGAKTGNFYFVKYSFDNPNLAELQQSRQILDTVKIKEAGFTLSKKKRNQFQER